MHSSRFVINFIPRIRKDKHVFTFIGVGIRKKHSIDYLAIIMHSFWYEKCNTINRSLILFYDKLHITDYNNKLINKRIGDVKIDILNNIFLVVFYLLTNSVGWRLSWILMILFYKNVRLTCISSFIICYSHIIPLK